MKHKEPMTSTIEVCKDYKIVASLSDQGEASKPSPTREQSCKGRSRDYVIERLYCAWTCKWKQLWMGESTLHCS